VKRFPTLCLAIALSALLAGATLANFELLLEDGRLLSGVDVRREEGQYLLEMLDGQTIPIPEELVAEVRITAGVAPGVVKADPLQVAGNEIDLDDEDRPASGLVKGTPEVLAGELVRPPRTSEQTAALGPPAEFARDIIDPNWRPESVFNASNDVTNFAPSTWAESIIDHDWKPESDYTQKSDVSNFAPSTFTESIIDNSWQPQDGFRKQGTSFQRDLSELHRLIREPVLARATTQHFGQLMPAASVRRPGAARLTLSGLTGTSVGRPLTAMRASWAPSIPVSVATSGGLPVSSCTWCPRFTLASTSRAARRSAPRDGPPTATLIRSCAESLFEPLLAASTEADDAAQLSVHWIIDEAFAELPIDLYEGLLKNGDEVEHRAVFTYSARDCRLIGGDLAELVGRKLSDEEMLDYGTRAYNKALATAEPVQLDGSAAKIGYALGVSALVIPGSADVRLLTGAAELEGGSDSCERSDRSRRRGARKIDRSFEPPRVEYTAGSDVVSFYSWSRLGGDVRSHRVKLADDGTVAVESKLLASHLGSHTCSPTH